MDWGMQHHGVDQIVVLVENVFVGNAFVRINLLIDEILNELWLAVAVVHEFF